MCIISVLFQISWNKFVYLNCSCFSIINTNILNVQCNDKKKSYNCFVWRNRYIDTKNKVTRETLFLITKQFHTDNLIENKYAFYTTEHVYVSAPMYLLCFPSKPYFTQGIKWRLIRIIHQKKMYTLGEFWSYLQYILWCHHW